MELPGCCEGGLGFVAAVRELVHSEFTARAAASHVTNTAGKSEERDPRLYTKAGALRKPVRDILAALPGESEGGGSEVLGANRGRGRAQGERHVRAVAADAGWRADISG